MEKKIKTKEKDTTIKVLDKKENIKHFSKPMHISEKADTMKHQKSESQTEDKNTAQRSAVQSITNQEKKVAHDSVFYAKRFVQNRREKSRLKKQTSLTEYASDGIHDTKDIKTKSAFKESRKQELLGHQTKGMKRSLIKNDSKKIQDKNYSIPFRSVRSDYQKHMKRHMLTKHKQKIKKAKQSTSSIKNTSSRVKDIFKGTITIMKKAVTGIHNLIAAGSFFIFLVVLVLFMAVFSVLSSDSGFNSETLPLSPEVLSYTETIEKYAKDYDMEDYINIIQAVMMQESS